MFRKEIFSVLLITISIAGSVSITGCSSSDEPEPTSPELVGNYNGQLDRTWQSLEEQGITAHKINAEGLERRFLLYVPDSLDPSEKYPVITVLHGANINAEITRQFDTLGQFEQIADEQGAIVIYGNACSSSSNSDPFFANTGIWTAQLNSDAVSYDYLDETPYFEAIWEELIRLQIPVDENRWYFIGGSNGAGAINQLRSQGDFYTRRIAAAAEVIGAAPSQFANASRVTHEITGYEKNHQYDYSPEIEDYVFNHPHYFEDIANETKSVSRLVVYSESDPIVTGRDDYDYATIMKRSTDVYAGLMGYTQAVVEHTNEIQLPDYVLEGEGYDGNFYAAAMTTNSKAFLREFPELEDGSNLSIIRLDRAGHGWPNPQQYAMSVVENDGQGFRNQDFDIADMAWNFFRTESKAN